SHRPCRSRVAGCSLRLRASIVAVAMLFRVLVRAPAEAGMRSATTCSGGVGVTVSIAFDEVQYPDTAGLRVRLSDPTAAVSIPGSKSSEQVNSRVTNLTPLRADQEDPEALFAAADVDTDGDGRDDQVVIGLVTRSEPIRSGPLARINFDCVTGVS